MCIHFCYTCSDVVSHCWKPHADQEKDIGESAVKQARNNTPSDSKLKQVRFITSGKVHVSMTQANKPSYSVTNAFKQPVCVSKNSKPAMAKQKTEAKQRASANKEKDKEVFEVEAILSHRKVSTAPHGPSNVIIERYCSFLWFIEIVSVYIYIPHLRNTCCLTLRWGAETGEAQREALGLYPPPLHTVYKLHHNP